MCILMSQLIRPKLTVHCWKLNPTGSRRSLSSDLLYNTELFDSQQIHAEVVLCVYPFIQLKQDILLWDSWHSAHLDIDRSLWVRWELTGLRVNIFWETEASKALSQDWTDCLHFGEGQNYHSKTDFRDFNKTGDSNETERLRHPGHCF